MLRPVKSAFYSAGRPLRRSAFLLLLLVVSLRALGGAFGVSIGAPTLDRWMYPFNFEPGSRTIASTFASFDPRFDTRDAQFLLGWDTAALLPTNATPTRYLLRRVRVSVTIAVTSNRLPTFFYDPTYDSYVTYMTNQPGYVADADLGRPVELYGAGFRGGFTAETFKENSNYGPLNAFTSSNITIATRSAFAAQFDARGELVDVSNNVGQANATWTKSTARTDQTIPISTQVAHPNATAI